MNSSWEQKIFSTRKIMSSNKLVINKTIAIVSKNIRRCNPETFEPKLGSNFQKTLRNPLQLLGYNINGSNFRKISWKNLKPDTSRTRFVNSFFISTQYILRAWKLYIDS